MILTKQVVALTTQMTKRLRKRERERLRAEQRADQGVAQDIRREAEHQIEKVCFYYRRFGAEAKKCAKPYTFDKENKKVSH